MMTDQTVDFVRRSLDLGVLYARLHAKRGVSQRAKGFEIGICLP